MENTTNTTYEEALKHVKKIKGFYKHVFTYVVFNIMILIIKRKAILFVLNNNASVDKGFEDWMYINIWSTPVIWGLILIIHGLYVYRLKFSFVKGWEERQIKKIMNEDGAGEHNTWE